MKKAGVIFILFILYTITVCTVSAVTDWDSSIIIFIQKQMSTLPDYFLALTGLKIYFIMLYLPITIGAVYFVIKKLYKHAVILAASPYIAYWFNILLKMIIKRPRPPYELQIGAHTATYSYVSSHTIMMLCLWGMVIFYINKYCRNRIIRISLTAFSVIWIIFSGFSRIWLGVHNPTDVIGAYILGAVFLIIYIKAANKHIA